MEEGGVGGRGGARDKALRWGSLYGTPSPGGGAWLTIHRVQVSVLLEAAVVLVLLAADVARVPEIVCGGDGKTTRGHQGFSHVGLGWGGRGSS